MKVLVYLYYSYLGIMKVLVYLDYSYLDIMKVLVYCSMFLQLLGLAVELLLESLDEVDDVLVCAGGPEVVQLLLDRLLGHQRLRERGPELRQVPGRGPLRPGPGLQLRLQTPDDLPELVDLLHRRGQLFPLFLETGGTGVLGGSILNLLGLIRLLVRRPSRGKFS